MDERNRKAIDLQSELQNVFKAYPDNEYTKSMYLQHAWEKIASSQELEHTDNITRASGKRGTILVFVDNSHWAAELSMKKEIYRLLMERELDESLDEIKFLVNRKSALKKTFLKKIEQAAGLGRKEKEVKLTGEEERYAREMVSEIKSEELRERLYKAVKADFEWKKSQSASKLSQNPLEPPETT